MANMLEGGGKTPILPPAELQRMGEPRSALPFATRPLLGVGVGFVRGSS